MKKLLRLLQPKKKCIIVLGMHRSGTSCLTGTLQQAGVYLGDVVTYRGDNEKGNRERVVIKELNDDVLTHSGGTWDNPPKQIEWTDEHAERRDEILKELFAQKKKYAGFKDPRTLYTLPFWLDGIQHIPIEYIGTFRHPLAVAQSLHTRHPQQSLESFLELWYVYNLRFLEYYKQYHFPLVCFDEQDDIYQSAVERALKTINISIDKKNELFFDPSLRHQKPLPTIPVPDHIKKLYDEIFEAYKKQ